MALIQSPLKLPQVHAGGLEGITHDLPSSFGRPSQGLEANERADPNIVQEEDELARLAFQLEARKLELEARRLRLESKKQGWARASVEGEDDKVGTEVAKIQSQGGRQEVDVSKQLGSKDSEKGENMEECAPNAKEAQDRYYRLSPPELSKATTTRGAANKSDNGTTIRERVVGNNACSRCKRRGEECSRFTKSTGQYSACQGCMEAKVKCSVDDSVEDRSSLKRLANLSTAARKRSFLYSGTHPEDASGARPKRARQGTPKDMQSIGLFLPPEVTGTKSLENGRSKDDEILRGIQKLLDEQTNTRKVLEDIRDMLGSGALSNQQMLPLDYAFLTAEIDENELTE